MRECRLFVTSEFPNEGRGKYIEKSPRRLMQQKLVQINMRKEVEQQWLNVATPPDILPPRFSLFYFKILTDIP